MKVPLAYLASAMVWLPFFISLSGHAADLESQAVSPFATDTPPALTKEQREEIERQAVASVPHLIPPDAPASTPPVLAGREQVKAEKSVIQAGRTVTYQILNGPPAALTTNPAVEKKPAALVGSTTEPTERKNHVALFLSATVYDHKATELKWDREGRHYRILVNNLDFSVFRGIGRFDTPETAYSLVLGVGDSTLEIEKQTSEVADPKEQIISRFHLSPGQDFWNSTDFQVLHAKDNASGLTQTIEYQALGDLLTFYAANRDRLIHQQALQKAENEARKRWLDAHPTPPQNTRVQFWPLKNPKAAAVQK